LTHNPSIESKMEHVPCNPGWIPDREYQPSGLLMRDQYIITNIPTECGRFQVVQSVDGEILMWLRHWI
jgi:hypothetical protein